MSDWAHQLISKCLQRSARRAISPINLYRTRNLSFATSGIAPWWIIEVNACLSNDSKRGPSGGSVPWFLHAFASFLNSCFGDFSVCVCYQEFAVLFQQSVVLHRQVRGLFLHGTNVVVRLLQSCETNRFLIFTQISSSLSQSSSFNFFSSSSLVDFTYWLRFLHLTFLGGFQLLLQALHLLLQSLVLLLWSWSFLPSLRQLKTSLTQFLEKQTIFFKKGAL